MRRYLMREMNAPSFLLRLLNLHLIYSLCLNYHFETFMNNCTTVRWVNLRAIYLRNAYKRYCPSNFCAQQIPCTFESLRNETKISTLDGLTIGTVHEQNVLAIKSERKLCAPWIFCIRKKKQQRTYLCWPLWNVKHCFAVLSFT